MRVRRSALVFSTLCLVGLGACGALACSSFSAADAPALPEAGTLPADGSAGDAEIPADAAPAADAGTSAYRAAVLGAGPIGYWRMGSVGPGNDVPDEIGRHPLLLEGGGHQVAVPGAIPADDGANQAVRFDGVGSYARVTDAAAFDFAKGAPFTVECWARREGPEGGGDYFQNLVGKIEGFDPNARGYVLYVAPREPANEIGGLMANYDASAGVFGHPAVAAGVWAHYALVFDGAALTLYVDGSVKQARALTNELPVRTGDLIVGRDPRELNSYWSGAIDEIAIYPRALSLAQIMDHHALGH